MFLDQILFIILKKGIFLKNKPVFYDSDCLVSFLVVDEHHILCKMFSKIIIPSPVHDEIFNKSTPTKIKDNLESLINDNFVEVKDINIFSNEYSNYKLIEKGFWTDNKYMGKGESSVIACAIENKGIIASNNLSDIEYLAKKHELPILTSSLILGKAYENNLIDEEKANNIWQKMIDKNISLPNVSFSNYYEFKYNNDWNKLFKSK